MRHRLLAAPEFLLHLVARQPRVAIGASGLLTLLLVQAVISLVLRQPI